MSPAGGAVGEHRRQVGGLGHRWVERGEGAPVVLVHGIPTSAELWRHVLPLVDGARLLAWEIPATDGRGMSPPMSTVAVGCGRTN